MKLPAIKWTQKALLLPVFLSFSLSAQPLFDVLHYDIVLDLSNIGSRSLRGCCTVQLRSMSSTLQQVKLELLKLTVDSVIITNAAAAFTYNDTLLSVLLPRPLSQNDTLGIKICYHGQPVEDATWGGFYFTGDYAYNMGVGFSSNPHNLGKVWFPCVDNFTDRAVYDFHITTSSSHKAFCNGVLQGAAVNPDATLTWHWKMNQPIPAYLASVAVSAYTSLDDFFTSITGSAVPVVLAAQPADTGKLKSSFIHLPDAFAAFEQSYGQHAFDRVGYVLVPFSGGAMEHATNICYSRALVTGGLEYETTMAHELSHHWWGNMVTCQAAEDMWLNEGWAVFSEKIFLERVYGKESYTKEVRKNHKEVLQYAHLRDDGYRAVSGVPHQYTYGITVYDKGADVAHTLRGYLGDSIFFSCITDYLQAFKFNHASSYDFRDRLSRCSGMDLTPFFNNWVFNPGFPHFSVDSFFAMPNGSYCDVTVFISQRLKAAPQYYSGVPLELTFMSGDFDSAGRTVLFSGSCGIYHTTLSFPPVFVALDMHEKISDAITDKFHRIGSTGSYDFEEAMMTLNVTQAPSTALVRVEHHWVAPDPMKTVVPYRHISDERYWKVDGIIPHGFIASARILYDGTAASGFLDQRLITNLEDSIVVLFRPDKRSDWSVHPDFVINTQGSASNKRGQITVNNISKGEYTLAIWDHARQTSDTQAVNSSCVVLGNGKLPQKAEPPFQVFPNPANDSFYIEFAQPVKSDVNITIFDLSGRRVGEFFLKKGGMKLAVSAKGWSKTTYLVNASDSRRGWEVKQVMVLY